MELPTFAPTRASLFSRHMKGLLAALAGLCLVEGKIHAVTTVVSFDSGGLTVMLGGSSTPVSGGTAADHDGAVLQLGYFSAATTANNFAGTWVPLSGQLSLNTAYNNTTIGDLTASGAGDGSFALSLTFDPASSTTGNNLPSSTTIPLAIRFYNGTTIANSTAYNTVSDDLWLWKTPGTSSPIAPTVGMSLADSNLEWQSIAVNGQAANTAFHTSIPSAVPEPSTSLLALLGGMGLMVRRRRK